MKYVSKADVPLVNQRTRHFSLLVVKRLKSFTMSSARQCIQTQQKVHQMQCNKTRYPNERAAKNVISKAWSGHATWRGKRLPTRCYQCKVCKSWHLTSKPLLTPAELVEQRRSLYQSMA